MENMKNKRFRVSITIAEITNRNSTIVYGLPTFEFDAATHGLLSEAQAQKLAESMISQLIPDAGISVCAVEV